MSGSSTAPCASSAAPARDPAAAIAPNLNATAAQDGAQAAAASQLLRERERKRQHLKAANLHVWSSGPSPPPKALDSNLKKNTAFVKRVKQSLGVDAKEQLLRDLGSLNLDKYLEEIIQAVPDGLLRCTNARDCLAAAEILSAFLGRFGGDSFSAPLTQILATSLSPPNRTALQTAPQDQRERDETARVARQKTLLRITAELALVQLVGHTKEQDSTSWLFQLVKELLSSDREHVNVPILITLLKALGTSLLDPAATSAKEGEAPGTAVDGVARGLGSLSLKEAMGESLAKLDEADPELAPLVSAEMKAKFRKLFETYFTTLSRRIVREHQRLQDQDRKNHEAYIRSGEIFEDRQQNYEKMTKTFERLHDWGKVLSELLGVAMPELADNTKSSTIGLGVNLDSKSAFLGDRDDEEFASNQSPWEDDDTRKFYEDLLDLGDILPPSILNAGSSSAKDEPASSIAAGASAENTPKPSETEVRELDDGGNNPVSADGVEDQMSAGPAAQLNSLLAKLPDMTNRAMIDSAAVDFAFISGKPARRRLVKHLASIPRSRLDLIPYYARLVATLNKYMPDVGTGLIALLDDEFRYFQRKRNTDLTESRAKNARFLSELTKFRVTPTHTIFHCLKICLEDFSGPNIDILATFLEACGRYLLRTEDTSAKMRSMLEMLRRKRAVVNLDARQLLMLDNAYYQCNPPERKAIEQKERTPMELFIRHLVYDVLTKATLERVLKLLRRLHWEDPEVVAILKAVFTRAWRVKFSNIHLLVILVYDLQRYHSDFSVLVIDQVFENIRVGLEQNIFKHNQRRVATVKYLGELYNYRLVSSAIVFDQLWSFTRFGHPGGRPVPGQVTPLDAPDDYFRIRLVCTLLDTCGMCFDRGSLKKKLDEFLLFFNLYVLCKEQPLPMEIEFMLSDTLELLRPDFKFKHDLYEAVTAVDEMIAAHRLQAASGVEDDDDDDEDEDESDDDDEASGDEGRRERKTRNGGAHGVAQAEEDEEDSEETDSDASDTDEDDDDQGEDESDEAAVPVEEDEAIMRRREEEATIKKEVEAEFDRELAKMMADSAASAGSGGGFKMQNRGLLDVGLPVIRRNQASSSRSDRDGATSGTEEEEDAGSHMRFSLLSKKGNKQMVSDSWPLELRRQYTDSHTCIDRLTSSRCLQRRRLPSIREQSSSGTKQNDDSSKRSCLRTRGERRMQSGGLWSSRLGDAALRSSFRMGAMADTRQDAMNSYRTR